MPLPKALDNDVDVDINEAPPSAQSTSRAALGSSTSVSKLVPRRRDVVLPPTLAAAVPRPALSGPAADRSSSASTGKGTGTGTGTGSSMMRHCHVPSSSNTTTSHASPSDVVSTRPFFDPWNSSSTGHQRAENRLSGSTSWRSSRNLKLGEQYKGGLGGERRVADTVGAGSADFGDDGRKANGGWRNGAKGLRPDGQKTLADVWGKQSDMSAAPHGDAAGQTNEPPPEEDPEPPPNGPAKQIFDGLCFYLNGSTAPLISDHKLRHLLAAHGASHSVALGRRTVTHVILGTTCGGRLSASKLEKEITRLRGESVKFVTAEWVLSSVAASKRLPESSFAPLKLVPQSQNSLFRAGLFAKPNAS